jgi:NAD(P)-dependent dehydrogenase (short-subunit alcohol dehydrogenase family)
VARLLAAEGADVAVADLGSRPSAGPYRMAGPDDLDRTVSELRSLGRRALAIEADVTSAADCERMAAEAIDGLGHIDVLVANAGGATLARAWEITEEAWDFVHGVCLKGVWLTTKYVVPHMIERRSGKIIVTASRNGLRAEHGYAHYNAAKAGAIHYAKSLALELGPYEINVNVVCPTQMTDRSQRRERTDEMQIYMDQVVGHPGATYEEFDRASGRDNLFEERGQPDFAEVAEGVLWLAGDRSHLVTGLALPMDAGWIAKRGG